MSESIEALEVDGPQGHAIAAAMREVAQVDGMHEAEADLINRFVSDLPPSSGSIDLAVINTDSLRALYVKSMILVAFADGALTDLERGLIAEKSATIGFDGSALPEAYREVAKGLLGNFSGVRQFRNQAVEIGRSLGLSEPDIEEVLG